jgi:hypothetical protein
MIIRYHLDPLELLRLWVRKFLLKRIRAHKRVGRKEFELRSSRDDN